MDTPIIPALKSVHGGTRVQIERLYGVYSLFHKGALITILSATILPYDFTGLI